MRTKHTFRLPPDLAGKLADYAARKRVPQALVVEAALASHLSPDGADRLEAALARRLDRMTRQMERLERHVTISNEALARVRALLADQHAAAARHRSRGRADQRAGSATTVSSKRWAGGWRAGATLADEVSQRRRSRAGTATPTTESLLTADPAGRLVFLSQSPTRLISRCCRDPFPALSNQPR